MRKVVFKKLSSGSVLMLFTVDSVTKTYGLNPSRDIVSSLDGNSIVIEMNENSDRSLVFSPTEIDFLNSIPSRANQTNVEESINTLMTDFFFEITGNVPQPPELLIIPVDFGEILTITQSTQIYTTGNGTGNITINISESMNDGVLLFVSDLANALVPDTMEMIINSGSLLINKGDGTLPENTFTMDSAGMSFTFRKMDSESLMIIGTNQ